MDLEAPQLCARIEEIAFTLVEQKEYARALPYLELRLAQPDPALVLLPTYVLCLGKSGQPEQASRVATRTREALDTLPQDDRTAALRALLHIAIAQAGPAEAAVVTASDEELFGGARPGPKKRRKS